MSRVVVTLKPLSCSTRLLLTCGEDDVLKAVLPPAEQIHPRAARMLLEALSLWFQRPLSVVLCADTLGGSSVLGLCDDFGFGCKTLHYEVEVRDPSRRRRGLGSFRDLHQLALRSTP